MAFTDTGQVGDLHLGARISIEHDGVWLVGEVTGLALTGEDLTDVRITLHTDGGRTKFLDRDPTTMYIIEWREKEER